jgi:hypothetical protein
LPYLIGVLKELFMNPPLLSGSTVFSRASAISQHTTHQIPQVIAFPFARVL